MRCCRNLFCLFLIVGLFLSSSVLARPTSLACPDTNVDDLIKMAMPRRVEQGNLLKRLMLNRVLQVANSRSTEDLGFLTLTLDSTIFQGVAPEPNSWYANTLLPYLQNSKVLQDSLRLRRTARMVRYQITRQELSDVCNSVLSEEQKASILSFMSQQIDAPLIISPQPFASRRMMSSMGPYMNPMGVEKVCADTGDQIAITTSLVVLQDLSSGSDVLFSMRDALKNDTLAIVVAHENAHAIMFDMYGRAFIDIERPSTNGHDAPLITDLGMAYLEGWAEAFEAIYGPKNLRFKESDREKYNISEFLFTRQDPIRRNRYIWANHYRQRTGELKNALQMMSTEGMVASLFYDILTSRAITAAYEKCVGVMYYHKPLDFMEFIDSYIEQHPEDANVIRRIVLESTKYVTTCSKASKLYKNYYQSKVAYKQQRISRSQYQNTQRKFIDHKEQLFKEVSAGKRDIFANTGKPMWMEGKIELEPERLGLLDIKGRILRRLRRGRPSYYTFRLDLNTVTVDMLTMLGFCEELAAEIVNDRDSKGSFEGNPIQILASYNEKIPAALNLKLYNRDSVSEENEEQLMSVLWPEDFERMRIE